jgi:hypothetical protein
MKLLLDESIPRRLARLFPGDFETMTVPQMGLRIVVLIAARTRLQELEPLVPKVVDLLKRESPVGVYRVAV